MTWNPKTWDFKTWFVLLLSTALLGIVAGIWVFRSFDDALRVAGVGLPAVVAAVLAWGLSEISRRDERSAQERRFDREQELQDQRLRDDRNHQRTLRDADLESRRIDDYREFQRTTLHAMQDVVSGLRKNLIAAAELSMVIPF